MKSLFRLLLPLSLVVPTALAAGCVVTPNTWTEAGSRDVREDALIGVLISPDGQPKLAVVRYVLHKDFSILPDQQMYALIPLGDHGTPAEPFGYTGPVRVPSKIEGAVSPEQRATIFSGDLPIAWLLGNEAKTVLESARFRRVATKKSQIAVATHPDEFRKEEFEGQYDGRFESYLVVIAFAAWNEWPSDTADPKNDSLPSMAGVLIMPGQARRPSRAITITYLEAIPLTPVALAADAGVTVLAIVYVPLWLLGIVHGR